MTLFDGSARRTGERTDRVTIRNEIRGFCEFTHRKPREQMGCQVLVNCPDGRAVWTTVSAADSLEALFARVTGLAAENVYGTLTNGRPVSAVADLLAEAERDGLSIVHVHGRVHGGGKKRKKKTYTTPKKIKHKHKKVKLATLKYYAVDDSNKITRLRKECPNECCGAGVFMAQHRDRIYCGKCGLTYVQEDKA